MLNFDDNMYITNVDLYIGDGDGNEDGIVYCSFACIYLAFRMILLGVRAFDPRQITRTSP